MKTNNDKHAVDGRSESGQSRPVDELLSIAEIEDMDVLDDLQIKGSELAGQTVRIQFRSTTDPL